MSDQNNQNKKQHSVDNHSTDDLATTHGSDTQVGDSQAGDTQSVAAQPTNSAPEYSTGQILANARNAMGISIEDLAEQIRVPLNVVKQIEADDIPTNLPETFVRGYIRSYAKKVGIAESAVLKEIDSMAASAPDAMEMHSFSKRSKRKRIERRLTIITWAIVAVLAIALVAWWVQTKGAEMLAEQTSALTSSADAENSSDNSMAEPTGPANNPNGMPVDTSEELDSGSASIDGQDINSQEANSDSADDTESTVPQSQLTIKAPATQESPQPINTSEQNQGVQDVNDSSVVGSTQNSAAAANGAANSETENSVVNAEQAPVVLSKAEQRLLADNGEADPEDFMKVEFEFENDCWVEVYDAFEERIAIGNKPAGYLMSLDAQGPFRVLLGNPAGVKIWVNGSPFDMSDLPKNRVARFEVDANL